MKPRSRILPSILMAMVLLISNSRAAATQTPSPDDLRLPVKEIHPTGPGPASDILAVFITGDGGWAALDRDVVAALAAHGIWVAGLDSRAYLGKRRTPDEVGHDVARLTQYYANAWKTKRIVLAGYSRGADLMPFALNRFPAELKQRVVLVGLLGLATRVGFEFHWQDVVRTVHRPGDQLTIPELERLRGTRILCVYGTDEEHSGCREAPQGMMQVVGLKGSHHFDGNYRALGELIANAIPPAR